MKTSNKTLLQILIEELPTLEGVPSYWRYVFQDYDKELRFDGCCSGLFLSQLANHFRECFEYYNYDKVTREQYEAALAASQKPAADADGWIEWHGGECPVDGGKWINIRHRDGCEKEVGKAGLFRWDHRQWVGDIIAYRLHQPQDANSRANDDRLAQDVKAAHQVTISVNGSAIGGAPFDTDEAANAYANRLLNVDPNGDEDDLNECIGQAAPEWDGQGVPPVGTEVEWREGIRWYPGFITAVGEKLIVIKDQHGNEGAHYLVNADIRPVNFARDELAAILERSADNFRNRQDVFKLAAADVLAAGYRKQ